MRKFLKTLNFTNKYIEPKYIGIKNTIKSIFCCDLCKGKGYKYELSNDIEKKIICHKCFGMGYQSYIYH